MNRTAAIFSFLLLTACATPPGAAPISLRVLDEPADCTMIGRIASDAPLGTRKQRELEVAVSRAKALAADSGANAIYFEETHSKLWGSTVLARALVCSDADLAQAPSSHQDSHR